MESMTPEVPYPFLAILSNDQLDAYFAQWRDPLARGLNIQTVAGKYKSDDNLESLIESDEAFNQRIRRGLRGFSMRNFVVPNGQNQYVFLPAGQNIDNIFRDLDQRAVPFCQFGYQQMGYAKYLFIENAAGLTPSEVQSINRNFGQAPSRVDTNEKNAIRLLTISTFDI